jgi:hypothetical protein
MGLSARNVARRGGLECTSSLSHSQGMKKYDCNGVLNCSMRWMVAQPPFLDRNKPLGRTETLYYREVDGFQLCLPRMNFPRDGFEQGSTHYCHVGDRETGFFWVNIDEDFERIMAAWRARWGPNYDAHMVEHESHRLERFRNITNGPEAWRVSRANGNLPRDVRECELDHKWEPSREFSVMATIVDVRTLIPDREKDPAQGWVVSAIGLHRPDEGLVLIDPDTDEVHTFGMEPTELPKFLLPFGD